MLYEYAVEPRAIGSGWDRCKYLIEQFGFDRGRLISQFPKHWFREAYHAAGDLPPVQKSRVEEALRQARNKNRVVRFNRPYDPNAGDWLHNALGENQRLPFHAVIALENPDGNAAVLIADDVDELQPLMDAPRDRAVQRDERSLSSAMEEMLRFGSRILFVDPFYDPFAPRYQRSFREFFRVVASQNPDAVCEIHYRYHPDKPTNDDLEREAAHIFPRVIPNGMTVTIYCWRQKAGGADFHARYLLTEKGGIGVDAGFSAEGGNQTTDMHLMSFELSQEKLKLFARAATDYELMEPVIRVAANGHVETL